MISLPAFVEEYDEGAHEDETTCQVVRPAQGGLEYHQVEHNSEDYLTVAHQKHSWCLFVLVSEV